MHIQHTRLYRIRDVAEHPAVSVATIYSVMESGQLTAVMVGTKTGTLCTSGAAVLACAQPACALLGIDDARVVVVA
jgi:hypothetical protein